jgi:hypothetical protein
MHKNNKSVIKELNMSTEAMQEFLARGGKITQCKPGPEKFDNSSKYRKDKMLTALKLLAKQVKDPKELTKVEEAIYTRIQILKTTF